MPTINVNQANASETTKGIVEEATQAQLDAGTDTGETGAQLFAPPSKLAITFQKISSLFTSVMALVLTGFTSGANLAVTATDTLAQALAKFQGQINARATTNDLTNGLATKQDTLVSGMNIKTINSNSLLGAGDLAITGDWELVDSATAANDATIEFIGLGSTYQAYAIVLANIIPQTDTATLNFRTSSNNGSSFDSSAGNYRHARQLIIDTPTTSTSGSTSATEITLAANLGTNIGENLNGIVWLYKPSAANYTQITTDLTYFSAAAVYIMVTGGGIRISAADVDAIQFIMSSGNIASGEFRLYGLKNA